MVIKEGDLAYSINTYIADGTTNTFPLAFTLGILSRSHVTCRVNEEEDSLGAPLYRSLTWLSDALVTVHGTIAAGDTVVFYRTVPKDALNQVYSDGSGLSDDALNNNNKHLIMITHEVMDGRFYFSGASYGWDMHGNRLYNLPTPVENSDAVTKQYVDELAVVSGNVPPPLLTDGNKPLVANNTGGYSWANTLGPMSMHSVSLVEDLPVAHGGTGASAAEGARANLGLDTMATQAANNVAITGGTVSDITSLSVNGNTVIGDSASIMGGDGVNPDYLLTLAGGSVPLGVERRADSNLGMAFEWKFKRATGGVCQQYDRGMRLISSFGDADGALQEAVELRAFVDQTPTSGVVASGFDLVLTNTSGISYIAERTRSNGQKEVAFKNGTARSEVAQIRIEAICNASTLTIHRGVNAAGLSSPATNRFRLTFGITMPDTNYGFFPTCGGSTATGTSWLQAKPIDKQTTYVDFVCVEGNFGASNYATPEILDITITR